MLSTNYDINLVKVKITQEDFKKGREWTYIYIYMLKSVVFAIEIPRLSPFRALHSARSSNVGVLVLVIKKENNNNNNK